MIVKLADGLSRQQVARDLGCAPATVVRTWHRYRKGGEERLLDQRAGNGPAKVDARYRAELWQVLLKVPTDFGWQRPTWTRELLALEIAKRSFPRVADCTMGRALCAIGARLTAPKPIVLCPWDRKRRERVLASLRHLANHANAAEPVFFEDEMDVHLNPKIGRDWMVPGHRRFVITPGKNKKHFVAGALNAATRKLIWVEGLSKSSDLFCRLVWKLATEHRRARRINLILDNYIIHASKKSQAFLAQFEGPRCPPLPATLLPRRQPHRACVARPAR